MEQACYDLSVDELEKALERRDKAKADYDKAVEQLYDVLRAMMQEPANRHGLKTQLAERTGYSRQHLRRIEQGEPWRKGSE